MSKFALSLLALLFIFQVVACGTGKHTLNLTPFNMPRDQQLARINTLSQDDSLATFAQQSQKLDSTKLNFMNVANQARGRFVVRDSSMGSVAAPRASPQTQPQSAPRNQANKPTQPTQSPHSAVTVQSTLKSIQIDVTQGTLTIAEVGDKTSLFKGDLSSGSTVKTLSEVTAVDSANKTPSARTAKLACMDKDCNLQVILIKTMSQSKLVDIKSYLYMKIDGTVKDPNIDGETAPITDPKAVNFVDVGYDVAADSVALRVNVNSALVGGSSKVPTMTFVSDLFSLKHFVPTTGIPNPASVSMHYNKKISATMDVDKLDDGKYLDFTLPSNKTLGVLINNSFNLF